MWQQVANGTRTDLNEVTEWEDREIAEGQRAKLDCRCAVPVSTWQMDALRNSLSISGVEDLQINGYGSTISITWRKGFPWAIVVILALIAIIVIVSWIFYKDVFSELPAEMKSVVLVVAAVLAVAVSYNLVRRKSNG